MERRSDKHGKENASTVSGFNLVKDVFHIFALSICTSHRGFFADGIKKSLFFGPYDIFIVEVYTRINNHIFWSIVESVVYVEQQIRQNHFVFGRNENSSVGHDGNYGCMTKK